MWDAKSEEATPVEPLKVRHPTKLTVYIAEPLVDPIPGGVPYITTSRLSAKKFYTKKQALKYGRKFGGCYVDVVWRYQKSMQHGKRNRDFCLAPLNRVEILEGHKCLHNCKYCFLGSY